MIKFTDSAAEHIKKYVDGYAGLKLGVKTSGCNGFEYTVECIKEIESNDVVYEDHNIKIFVDKDHLKYLDGIEIDFVTLGHNQFLEYRNPNIKEQCGCGKSFSID